MEKKIRPAVLIGAVKSGSGKTTFTCALLEALKQRKMKPCSFKCGPDYIDPMFHKTVIGIPSDNLDSFFSTESQIKEIFAKDMNSSGIAVIEGAMGLFDGLGGISEEGSAYQIASILNIPIILIVDAHGMGRSLLPLISGFLEYDSKKLIKGVVLNKIPESFCTTIKPIIEKQLDIEVLGCIPKFKDHYLESRHLGLKMPGEIEDIKMKLEAAADTIEKNIDIDRLIEIATENTKDVVPVAGSENIRIPRVRIAVAQDEAFCFYYEENFNILREQGAELIRFSPLHDEKLPPEIDGIILGGGYPELYAEKLEKNTNMKKALKSALDDGMPSLAECGGFMYLHDELEDQNHRCYKMCGVCKGKCFYTGKLVRFGYVNLEEKSPLWLNDGTIKAHEFHYFDSENNGSDCTAVKPVTGRTWDCVHSGKGRFWGFPHLYYASNKEFPLRFVEEAVKFKNRRQDKKHE